MHGITSSSTAGGIGRVRVVQLRRLLAGCLTLLLAGCPAPQEAPQAPPPAPVAVSTVLEREVTIEQSFVGTVMPLRVSTVGSPMEGRVVEFLANEGDYVRAKKEQQDPGGPEDEKACPLVKLRSQSIEIGLAAARAELRVRQAERDELIISAPKEIEQAQARKEAAEALKKFAQSRLERMRGLYKKRVITDDELEEQISVVEEAAKVYLEKQVAWELAAETDYWKEKINQAKARVEVQQETIKRLEDDLEQHKVYAPFDGYVTQEYTEVGQWVAKGDPIAEIVELKEVDIEVAVPESHIAYISQLPVGTTVPVKIDALPETTWNGSVVLIVPQANVRSRSFPVKVRLKNPRNTANPNDLILKPGMFARVTLPVKRATMLLIPKDALVLGGTSPMIWVVEQNPGGEMPETAKVKGLQIEKGVSIDLEEEGGVRGWVEVRGLLGAGDSPLKPGQRVIVEGNERLREGQTVKIVNAVGPGFDASPSANRQANKADRKAPK